MIIKEIVFESADYRKECKLRNEVLRIPLGLNLFNEDLSREGQQTHFGMFDQDDNLLACAIAVPDLSTGVKIRQMAVDPLHQGKGHGRRIILYLEAHFTQRGFSHFFLNARLNPVGFYQKMGYSSVGSEFIEVGIPHIKMEKFI